MNVITEDKRVTVSYLQRVDNKEGGRNTASLHSMEVSIDQVAGLVRESVFHPMSLATPWLHYPPGLNSTISLLRIISGALLM